jgi:hypothetical protein
LCVATRLGGVLRCGALAIGLTIPESFLLRADELIH